MRKGAGKGGEGSLDFRKGYLDSFNNIKPPGRPRTLGTLADETAELHLCGAAWGHLRAVPEPGGN